MNPPSEQPGASEETTGATPADLTDGSRLARLGDAVRSLGRPGAAPTTRRGSQRQVVNGLDEREWRYSLAATVLAIGLVVAGYLTNRHSSVEKVRSASSTLLVAGIIIIAVMVIGVAFRRRAMVGFSNFMVGFELITGGNVLGVLFLGFGGWLLLRALRRQREEQKARGGAPPVARQRKPVAAPLTGPPKPSKRYTPPRRSKTAGRRK